MKRDAMRKLLLAAACVVATSTANALPASAAGWYYTGYWYFSAPACEAGYQQLAAGKEFDLPHECRYNPVGVFELWRVG